jgi:NADH-quinone oxidoreductase subunit M
LGAVYSLILIQRSLHGAAQSNEPIAGINARELTMMLSLIFLLVWLGLYPQPVLDTSAAVMTSIEQLISNSQSIPAAQ